MRPNSISNNIYRDVIREVTCTRRVPVVSDGRHGNHLVCVCKQSISTCDDVTVVNDVDGAVVRTRPHLSTARLQQAHLSINHRHNTPVHLSINHRHNTPVHLSVNHSHNTPVHLSINHSNNSISHSNNTPVHLSVNHSNSTPVHMSITPITHLYTWQSITAIAHLYT